LKSCCFLLASRKIARYVTLLFIFSCTLDERVALSEFPIHKDNYKRFENLSFTPFLAAASGILQRAYVRISLSPVQAAAFILNLPLCSSSFAILILEALHNAI
jgi:hypothetical protein